MLVTKAFHASFSDITTEGKDITQRVFAKLTIDEAKNFFTSRQLTKFSDQLCLEVNQDGTSSQSVEQLIGPEQTSYLLVCMRALKTDAVQTAADAW